MAIVDLNVFVLMYYIIVNWGWNKAIRQLEVLYNACNFKVNLFYKTLWILQDKQSVTRVLSGSNQSQLTYANHNFFASHPFKKGIGNINTSEEMWHDLHESLASSLQDGSKNGSIERIMEKHKRILLNNEDNIFQIGGKGDVLEKYLTAVWAEFCFGPNITQKDYSKMRKLLLKTIRSTFYNHNDSFVPFIGYITCKIRQFWYCNDYAKLESKLVKLLGKIPKNAEGECFFSLLKTKLALKNLDGNNIGEMIGLGKAMIDNAFLSVLALDFIHILFTQVIFAIMENNLSDKSKIFTESLTRGFLFPWRSRQISGNSFQLGENIICSGDIVMINLVKAELFFSSGQRSCIAPGFVKKCYNKLLSILEPFQLVRADNKDIIYDTNENTPFVHSKHYVRLVLPRNCLKSDINRNQNSEGQCNQFDRTNESSSQLALNISEHKGVNFYHVHEITINVTLSDWISNEICRKVKEFSVKHGITFDGIISAEARGWLFATLPANKLGIPLYIARKSGKLPGRVICKTYQKEGYKTDGTESIEISLDVKNMSLIIIDDGIASGKTMEVLYDLSRSNDNIVRLIIPIIQHTYTECAFNPSPNETKMVTLFDL